MMANNNAMILDDDSQEYIIYDVLDVIFSHLTAKSLHNVALVSRSWNHAAKRELAKRKTLQRVLLPIPYNVEKSQLHLGDYFNVKPNTVLMFCGPKPTMRPVINLEYKIMEEYYMRVPGRIIILGADQVIMDEKEIRSCEPQFYYTPDASITFNNILGINLPNSQDFTIKVVECVSHEHNTESKAAKIFQQLQDSADQLDNPLYLLFSRNEYTIGSHVIKMFQDKYQNKPINVWGSTIADFIKRSDDGYPNYRGTHGFLGILLHSPRLRSHCLVLPINHEDIMTMRLLDFRRTLKLKRHSLGFICGPTLFVHQDESNNLKKHYPKNLMKLVKNVFSNVEFTGIFNSPDFYYYGCDHTNKDGDYRLKHKGALSIMILTYG